MGGGIFCGCFIVYGSGKCYWCSSVNWDWIDVGCYFVCGILGV